MANDYWRVEGYDANVTVACKIVFDAASDERSRGAALYGESIDQTCNGFGESPKEAEADAYNACENRTCSRLIQELGSTGLVRKFGDCSCEVKESETTENVAVFEGLWNILASLWPF